MRKGNAGYSLVEIVIAMALLAIITIPTYTCLNLSVKVNAAADQLLKAQLAVSSAVETLMAEGIDPSKISRKTPVGEESYFIYSAQGDITITVDIDNQLNDDQINQLSGYPVTVTCPVGASDSGNEVVVTTYVPKMDSTEEVTGE